MVQINRKSLIALIFVIFVAYNLKRAYDSKTYITHIPEGHVGLWSGCGDKPMDGLIILSPARYNAEAMLKMGFEPSKQISVELAPFMVIRGVDSTLAENKGGTIQAASTEERMTTCLTSQLEMHSFIVESLK